MCGCGGSKAAPAAYNPSGGTQTVGYAVLIPGGTKVQFTTQMAAEAYRQARNIAEPIVEVKI